MNWCSGLQQRHDEIPAFSGMTVLRMSVYSLMRQMWNATACSSYPAATGYLTIISVEIKFSKARRFPISATADRPWVVREGFVLRSKNCSEWFSHGARGQTHEILYCLCLLSAQHFLCSSLIGKVNLYKKLRENNLSLMIVCFDLDSWIGNCPVVIL